MRVLSLRDGSGRLALGHTSYAVLELRGGDTPEEWTNKTAQAETWTEKTKEPETWTDK